MERKKILFVEDGEHDREIYGKLLWYNGFDVRFARTGEEGLAHLEHEQPRLILLDLGLPGMSGQEVFERIRSNPRFAHVPVIIMTASPRERYEAWANSMGAAAFLEKPIAPVDVVYEVERLIGRAPLPGDIVAAERAAETTEPGSDRLAAAEDDRLAANGRDGAAHEEPPRA